MIWTRRNQGLLAAAAATLVAGSLTALGYRGQLTIAADITGAPFGAWDIVLMTAQDPYVIAYFLWPVMTILLGYGVSLRAQPAFLLRHGSRTAFLFDESLRAARVGAVLAVTLAVSSLTGTSGLGWEMAWSPLSRVDGELVTSLHAQAVAGLGFVPVLVAQVLYMTVSATCLGAAIALLALLTTRRYRPLVIAVALAMPVIFKAWPLPVASNPINALITVHALMSGLPLWAPPVASLTGTLLLGSLANIMDRRPSIRSSVVRLDPRWAWYSAIVGSGLLLMTPLQDPDLPLAYQLLYGASSEGVSVLHWAFAVIVWGGLTLVLMLRWSSTLTTRLPYLLLRHGRATRLIRREAAQDLIGGLICAASVLAGFTMLDVATGRPVLGWADALHVLLVGPLIGASVASVGVIASWLVHGLAPMTVTLVAAAVLSLPSLSPVWPWPTALAFLGARSPETPLIPLLQAAATWAALLTILTLLARRSAPSFD